MTLDIHSLLAWFLIGMLMAVPAQFLLSRGFGAAGDIGIGIVGALIGGFVASLLGLQGQPGLVFTSAAAFAGAALLTAGARAMPRASAV